MPEHRSYTRIDEEHLISFEVMAADHETVAYQGMAVEHNLSRSGLQLRLPVEVEIGDWLTLSLALVEKVIDVRGEVVWAKRNGKMWDVGFKLRSFPHENKAVIQAWWNDFTSP